MQMILSDLSIELPEPLQKLVTEQFLDALPLTPNGKLDRNPLSEPDQSRQAQDTDFIAPRSQVETLLAEIWGEVLSINRVGIHCNFFELGGHSLLATQLIIRVREKLAVEIPLTTLFDAPTIAELAKLIEITGARASNHSKCIAPQLRSTYKINNS